MKLNYLSQGIDLSGVKIKLESSTDPLPAALYRLKMLFEETTFAESQKEQLVKDFAIVEKECRTKEGRTLSKLSGAYNIICGYLERLTELNVDQKALFIKTFDSLLGGMNFC